MAIARAQLGEESFAAAWTEGQKMTLEQAMAFALEQTDDNGLAANSPQPSSSNQPELKSV